VMNCSMNIFLYFYFSNNILLSYIKPVSELSRAARFTLRAYFSSREAAL